MAKSEIPTCEGFHCVFFDAPGRVGAWGPVIRKCQDPGINHWLFRRFCAEHLAVVRESPIHGAFVALTATDGAVTEAGHVLRYRFSDDATDDPFKFERSSVLERLGAARNCVEQTVKHLHSAIQAIERSRMEVLRASFTDGWDWRNPAGDGWTIRGSDWYPKSAK